MDDYDHKSIESKWQEKWAEDNLYHTPDKVEDRDNFYALFEFPYPSGNLHIGHWYAYAVPDIFARFKQMSGYNVLYPIGFDSFGLPAENAAIKRNLDPRKWTNKNIEYMTGQLKRMGTSFDWSRSIRTSDPDYYRWTQWIFTKFFEEDLAYKKPAKVNWCPGCQTVLANEQVVNGLCERCDSEVENREMEQWFFKITDYAERLLDDLEHLDWPESIKEAQRNWIGKKEGTRLRFPLVFSKEEGGASHENLEVFTTRPDTLYGVTYLAVAPEHNSIQNLKSKIQNWEEVKKYIARAESKTDRERKEADEKTGVKLAGVSATHPATGEKLPIFVADYVLDDYGTGAIMAVPAHDERDYEFAKEHGINITQVITTDSKSDTDETTVITEGGILENSEEFTGLTSEEASKKITEKFGEQETTYRLRDWSVGRQRFWGTPIPIVYDPDGKPHPVPEEHLPWQLPDDVDHTPSGEPPLARSEELKKRTEEIFDEGWQPETETMDTFVDSSWYYLRYLDPENDDEMADKNLQQDWMPVDYYSGGAEHTTMHLLYSRFFYKALSDFGLASSQEPFQKRMNRGLIMGPDGQKMSKSRGNVVDPDDQVQEVGADTVRTYLAFVGPYNEVGTYPWDMGGIAGVRRFLERVWRQQEDLSADSKENDSSLLHQTIKKVTGDIEELKFNTAISALMEYLKEADKITESRYKILLQLLAPFAPHMTEELWQILGENYSIHESSWPEYDEEKLAADTVTIAVQVDGEVRGEITVSAEASEKEIVSLAKKQENVARWLADEKLIRHVFVPNRLVNFVTGK